MSEPPEITTTGPEHVWRQVARWIESRIESGELQPGDKLPAERDLAAELGVAYLTVRRAVRDLRDRGLLVSSVGRGTYVAER